MSRVRDTMRSRAFFSEFGAWRRATPAQRRLWAHCEGVARETARSNRDLIARHPDLVDRLIGLGRVSKIDQWNGFVPPAIIEIAENGDAIVNRSPYRVALIELIGEARRREAA